MMHKTIICRSESAARSACIHMIYAQAQISVSVCVCVRTYVQLQMLSEYSQHVTPRFMKVMIQVASEVGPIRFCLGRRTNQFV